MRTLGSTAIGILTYLAGYPVYTTENGVSLINLLIGIGCVILWVTVCDALEVEWNYT